MLLFYKNDKIALNLEKGLTVKVAFLQALSIYLTVLKLYMLEQWRFSVIALNHDVSGKSHFIEIISHSFCIFVIC